MESSEVFKDNVFINKAYNLYYDLQSGKTYEHDKVRDVVYKKFIGNTYKQKIDDVDIQIPIIDIYKKSCKNSLAIKPLLFNNMWQFCQYIRWAEKVVFYKNTADRAIYVDSSIDDLDCRLLVYTEDNIQIRFKLEKIDNPAYIPNTLSDILSMKSNTPRYFKSMKIVVERNYGKQMTNHFTIIDDNTDFKDFSDSLLYESIEKKLLDAYISIINEIYDIIFKIYIVED